MSVVLVCCVVSVVTVGLVDITAALSMVSELWVVSFCCPPVAVVFGILGEGAPFVSGVGVLGFDIDDDIDDCGL